jgi:hypothetical protein
LARQIAFSVDFIGKKLSRLSTVYIKFATNICFGKTGQQGTAGFRDLLSGCRREDFGEMLASLRSSKRVRLSAFVLEQLLEILALSAGGFEVEQMIFYANPE